MGDMPHSTTRSVLGRAVASAFGFFAVLAWSGCNTQARVSLPAAPFVAFAVAPSLSPVAEEVEARTAWHLAEDYVQHHPGCDVLVGSGDSMLPFYHDKTILVVAPIPMRDLRCGMTVIFTGDSGCPVAHVLMEKTSRGWRTMGLGNREPDDSTVRYDNYIGAVVRAFAPVNRQIVRRAEPQFTSEIAATTETDRESVAMADHH